MLSTRATSMRSNLKCNDVREASNTHSGDSIFYINGKRCVRGGGGGCGVCAARGALMWMVMVIKCTLNATCDDGSFAARHDDVGDGVTGTTTTTDDGIHAARATMHKAPAYCVCVL